METPDTLLFRLAARQHGLVTRNQARALGFTDRMIRYRLGNGMLEGVAPGVYRVAGAPITWHQRLLAACLGGGPSCLASHRAAAALHGFDGFHPGVLEMSVDRGRRYRPKGAIAHTTSDLAVPDRCWVAGIPATTPLRTLLDLGSVVPQHKLEEALDGAERDDLVDPEKLREVLAVVRFRGRNGVGPIATVLEDRVGKQPRTVLERKMLRVLEVHGLPRPLCQYRVVRPDGQLADLDFAYPDQGVAIEVDGHVGHATRRQRGYDARRGNQVVIADWRMLRFTWEDVTRRPAYVAETVGAALASRVSR